MEMAAEAEAEVPYITPPVAAVMAEAEEAFKIFPKDNEIGIVNYS